MLYGVEINLVDDGTPVAYRADEPRDLASAEYVVFDVETTGLSAVYDKVIELAAVKMKDGKVIDQFEEMIDPGFPLSELTINLTHITDDMVHGSKSEVDVFKLFQQFCDGAIMVGHNVTFDVGFWIMVMSGMDWRILTIRSSIPWNCRGCCIQNGRITSSIPWRSSTKSA